MSKVLTHFQCVGEFHEVFDYPVRTELYEDVFEQDPKLLKSRVAFLREERDEFIDAMKTQDLIEMADALCDLIYFAHGTGQCLGIDMDKCLDKPNMKHNGLSITCTPQNMCTDVDMHVLDDELLSVRQYLWTITNFINEFDYNCELEDLDEMKHSLTMVTHTTYLLGYFLNFNMDAMFREVHRSNMTKVCTTLEDADESVQRYKNAGTYAKPVVRTKGEYYVVYDEELNKILKCFKWEEPSLKQFMGPDYAE